MKKLILVFVMVFSWSLQGFSQSMSDTQIMEFVQKEQKKGTSQAQIVTKLMQKGVSVTKLQQLRKKYMGLTSSKDSGKSGTSTSSKSGTDRTSPNENFEENRNRKAYTKEMKKAEKSGTKTASTSLGSSNLSDEESGSSDSKEEIDTKEISTLISPDGTEHMTPAQILMYLGPDAISQNPELLTILLEENKKIRKSKVFGHDIFLKENLSFEPDMNIPTPQNYRLGPGDGVYIDIYGASQKTIETTVTPDGDVVIDDYGLVNVAGLTVAQANAKLRSTLGSRFQSSKIKLTVGQTRSITINVMGEVETPGTYTLPAFSNVFHALYKAEGVNDIGTLRNIKIYRKGKLVSTVDIYDYILKGKMSGNIRLSDGDVIIVGPYENIVAISGNVRRPLLYEMKRGEKLSDLIKYAGGFSGDAYQKQVRVYRNNGSMKTLDNVGEYDMSSYTLQDKDSTVVDKILNRYENVVEVTGAVFRPGMYNLGDNITSVRTLVEQAQGLKEDAFTSRSLIYRKKADRTTELLSVDIKGIMDGSVTDVPLKSEDVLFIPTITEKRIEPKLSIYGAVLDPGKYLYSDNETIEDLILQAGGLEPSASMAKIDVSRRTNNPYATEQNDTIAQTFSFSIKDGLIIEGGEHFILQPYDEVYVRKSPGYNVQQNITVNGAVQFPGKYSLPRKDTHLSEIIAMAGGYTNFAYVKGTKLVRQATEEEREQMKTLKRLQTMQAVDEVTSGIDETKIDTDPTYTVEIDAEKAMAHPGSQWDIVLRGEDILTIPENVTTVKVSGDVMFPNTISFQPGKSFRYYISQSGGWGNRAKKRDTYVIYMNGKVENAMDAKIEPGCEIVVPSKPKKEKLTPAERVAFVSGIASLATVMATLANILKK